MPGILLLGGIENSGGRSGRPESGDRFASRLEWGLGPGRVAHLRCLFASPQHLARYNRQSFSFNAVWLVVIPVRFPAPCRRCRRQLKGVWPRLPGGSTAVARAPLCQCAHPGAIWLPQKGLAGLRGEAQRGDCTHGGTSWRRETSVHVPCVSCARLAGQAQVSCHTVT